MVNFFYPIRSLRSFFTYPINFPITQKKILKIFQIVVFGSPPQKLPNLLPAGYCLFKNCEVRATGLMSETSYPKQGIFP